MEELLLVVAFFFLGAAAAGAWRVVRDRDADQLGDASSTVAPASEGMMVVTISNPASEPVVVTGRGYPSGRFRLWGRRQVRRTPRRREHASLTVRAARELLGAVPAGGRATWMVVGHPSTRPAGRVVLSLYQAGGRVRVHESVVRTAPGFLPLRPIGWVLARAHLGAAR